MGIMSNAARNDSRGIDIRTALSILSERSRCNNEHHRHQPLPIVPTNKEEEEQLKLATSGQVIQLFQEEDEDENKSNDNSKNNDNSNKEEPTKSIEEQKKLIEEQKKRNEIELKSKLNNMTVKELLQTIIQIQSERVITYKTFQNGLDIILKTNNMTSYPIICSNVTASFSLQSNTINMIKSILDEKYEKKKCYVKLITKLQSFEKIKLDYTTAYQLECIRLNHMKTDNDDDDNDNSMQQDEQYKKVRDLLQDGVKDLKKKIVKCMEDINDILEEIRYGILDEE